ncbi:hypothetical protein BDB00DRAFT_805753 [Zychaea mexicana]|uniref:uncharacterized protein n=1 Tax=Zychaea mexicana TaxID=64656 RepID=UPI0022FE2FE7|nr:uncharacterized protein BDB00DRAFT_805753 [Zychaea mexicana]KAI9497269.1 hypothetical protein BDB00DRAFT_805753 [Zychaea mexicana]
MFAINHSRAIPAATCHHPHREDQTLPPPFHLLLSQGSYEHDSNKRSGQKANDDFGLYTTKACAT